MRVGFVQFSPARYAVQANIEKIQALLDGMDFDLVVLPELANSGYLHDDPTALRGIGEKADGNGPFLGALTKIAKEHRACLVTGFSEISGERLYNSAAALSPTGILQVYRKTHLFSTEKLLFAPGDTGFHVFSFREVCIGMLICFDWIFPEAARTLSLKGAQLLAHPANLVLPWCQGAMLTRSLENAVFTITANRVGEESGQGQTLRFTGRSQVTDPTGMCLAQAGEEETTIKIVEINPRRALNKQLGPGNDLFADRQPRFYQL